MNLAIIGYGTIVSLALETLARELHTPLDLLSIYAKPDGHERAHAMLTRIGPALARQTCVTSDIHELIEHKPALVSEAAGHQALNECGAALLSSGIRLIVTSVGALADDDLRNSLDLAAQKGSTHYKPIAGAIGGFDLLAAARLAGLNSVTYTGRKPPNAWKGTRAETMINLNQVAHETIFFDDNAGRAAREYPQNANVAATLALAGLGFERTQVRLIADPAITRNVHEISVSAACADFTFRIEGYPAPENPKTSLTVAYSLASTLLQNIQADRS